MTAADRILSKLVAWGNADPNVRGLVLVGSRARNELTDDLADIDVQVYALSDEPYVRDDVWLSRFAPVWVCIHDGYWQDGVRVPTRLVIFDQGVKVDFAFYTAAAMTDIGKDDRPHKVLLDKDHAAAGIDGKRSGELPPAGLPTEVEFTDGVKEFWFEAYHVAKYLSRGELWLAKSRDFATKQLLLRIVEWNALHARLWDRNAHEEGKNMQSWVSREVWTDLHGAFARFDAADSWSALIATNQLFRRIALETAAALGFVYPAEVDRNISRFIENLRTSSSV
jgi:aminoglycoside 6-adenylyltransferase